MNWVDVLVLLLAILGGISGFRQGVVIALPALAGVLIGAIAGVRIAPLIVELFDQPVAKVIFAVVTVVFLVMLGETIGVWLGRKLHRKINTAKLAKVNSVLGAAVQTTVVFVVSWLVALSLTSVSGWPGLASAVNNSTILGGVNAVMPPSAQGLPDQLRKSLLDSSGFPSIVDPFQKQPNADVEPPDPSLQASPVVRELRASVLKINGRAPSCGRTLEGSGFVVAPQRVMTNAHVVAGTSETTVETTRGRLAARVVYFDPQTDVAILAVPRLDAAVLELAPAPAKAGDDAIVLGYPLDGPYTASSARIRQRFNLQGPNIYDSSTVRRDVFAVRAQVRSGNSGGPLVDPQGRVIGLVFGASVDNADTGYTLTADEIAPEVQAAAGLTNRVGTGPCVG